MPSAGQRLSLFTTRRSVRGGRTAFSPCFARVPSMFFCMRGGPSCVSCWASDPPYISTEDSPGPEPSSIIDRPLDFFLIGVFLAFPSRPKACAASPARFSSQIPPPVFIPSRTFPKALELFKSAPAQISALIASGTCSVWLQSTKYIYRHPSALFWLSCSFSPKPCTSPPSFRRDRPLRLQLVAPFFFPAGPRRIDRTRERLLPRLPASIPWLDSAQHLLEPALDGKRRVVSFFLVPGHSR